MKKLFIALIILNIATIIGSLLWILFDWSNIVPYMVYVVASIGIFINVYYYSKYLHGGDNV